ncbi:MAG: hypothetical protein QF718_10025 [Phycisphaerales bacterium]|nr:hypothetical protein [Phycisphaerales bacterium]
MKNFTTCFCILGLSGTAFGSVMDQIGPDDGSNIDTSNATASQNFESAYDIYDIATLDNFTGAGESINSVEAVVTGWNGYGDLSGITGWTVNLHSSTAAAAVDLTGDIGSQWIDPADAVVSATWAGVGGDLVLFNVGMTAAAGDNYVSVIPDNAFGSNGQTAIAMSTLGDGEYYQANPGGGFGMPGNQQAGAGNSAYRVGSGAPADPCTLDLADCATDIDGNGFVDVSDLLAVTASWGEMGDGTFRPAADIAPLPGGDCVVDVSDLLMVTANWGLDCNVYGACCYDDESCADLTEDNCAASGGTYKGDGTDCATTSCVAAAGDECSTALTASVGANPFDTSNMTGSAGMPDDTECPILAWGDETNPDVWFSWTATESAPTAIDTCDPASYDTSMVVYADDCVTQLACSGDAADSSGCQPYHSALTLDATAGTTYRIRIGGWLGDSGAGTLNINPMTGTGACCFPDETCIPDITEPDCYAFGGTAFFDGEDCSSGVCDAGAGDECSTAVAFVEGANPFDTTMMTPSQPQPDDSQCAGTYLDWTDSPDMWGEYVAPSDGTASFSACDPASYDTSMVLYEGDCDTQVACNGDSTVETGCQSFYSGIYDFPVTAGTSYFVRMGGWQGATGSGTVTITFTSGSATGACCVAGDCIAENTSSECEALGGYWMNGETCASAACPQPYVAGGCDVDENADLGCVCFVDGDDSETDCNGGSNLVVPTFTNLNLGESICGTSSVFVDGPTGGTYRDLDWYTNSAVNAGGSFDFTIGANSTCLILMVNLDLGTVDYVIDHVAGMMNTMNVAIPAGNWAIVATVSEWNTAWTCGSGYETYTLQVD